MAETFGASEQNALFLGSLRPETTEEELLEYFGNIGRVRRAKIIMDVVTMRSKQCGIIFCDDEETCEKILRESHWIGGKKVRVTRADQNKKGTKLIHTPFLLVQAPTTLSANSLADFFQVFGEIWGSWNLSPGMWLLRYAQNHSVSLATRQRHQVEGNLLECVPLDPMDLDQFFPEPSVAYLPPQPTSFQPSRIQTTTPLCKPKAKHLPSRYLFLVEYEKDPLFSIYCGKKTTNIIEKNNVKFNEKEFHNKKTFETNLPSEGSSLEDFNMS